MTSSFRYSNVSAKTARSTTGSPTSKSRKGLNAKISRIMLGGSNHDSEVATNISDKDSNSSSSNRKSPLKVKMNMGFFGSARNASRDSESVTVEDVKLDL